MEGSRREVLWSIGAVALTTVGFTAAFNSSKPAASDRDSDESWTIGAEGGGVSRAMPPAVMYRDGHVFVKRYSDGGIMEVRAASAPGILVLRDPNFAMAFILEVKGYTQQVDLNNQALMGFLFGNPGWEYQMEAIKVPGMTGIMPRLPEQYVTSRKDAR